MWFDRSGNKIYSWDNLIFTEVCRYSDKIILKKIAIDLKRKGIITRYFIKKNNCKIIVYILYILN